MVVSDAARTRRKPCTLDRFDTERCHRGGAEDPQTVEWIARKRLAGRTEKVNGAEICSALKTQAPTPEQRALLRDLFEVTQGGELTAIMAASGASVYEMARAMHLCGTHRGRAAEWIEQWAEEETGEHGDGR